MAGKQLDAKHPDYTLRMAVRTGHPANLCEDASDGEHGPSAVHALRLCEPPAGGSDGRIQILMPFVLWSPSAAVRQCGAAHGRGAHLRRSVLAPRPSGSYATQKRWSSHVDDFNPRCSGSSALLRQA